MGSKHQRRGRRTWSLISGCGSNRLIGYLINEVVNLKVTDRALSNTSFTKYRLMFTEMGIQDLEETI